MSASTPPPAASPATAAHRPPRLGARLAGRLARFSERLARSSRIFLLGLLIACGVEVVVDWNSILFEINVLRDSMRQRGENYARILAISAVDSMLAYDTEALDRLADGLFHDDDVVFIRFTDQQGTVMLDRVRDRYAVSFARRRKLRFAHYYATQMQRDINGILSEPALLAQRMASSRHRDFVQAWNDGIRALKERILGPPPPLVKQGGIVLYQDRLKQKTGGHESEVTYALSTVTDERGEDLGVVLVAFDMEPLNAQIGKKYVKGLGMVVFFVGLILIQSTLSRREKLRLFELDERQKDAKQALRAALPAGSGEQLALPGYALGCGLRQATGLVDGVAWDVLGPAELAGRGELLLLVVDPDGEGVSAVATALHVLRTFRKRCAAAPPEDLAAEVAELGAAAMTIPLTRPVHLWLVRIELGTGALSGISGPRGAARVVLPDGSAATALREEPLADDSPPGVIGPLLRMSGALLPGALLCGLFTGLGRRDDKRDGDAQALAEYLIRSRRHQSALGSLAADACTWTRGRMAGTIGDVLVLLTARANR